MTYADFIQQKSQTERNFGFKPIWMPDFLFDFQKKLVEWATLKGRSATFADCGLGKTPMQLVWCENVIRKTNKPTLIITPIAVGRQTLKEAEKFGIDAYRSWDGKLRGSPAIVITNYERLHYFNPQDFDGVACDESSSLKNFDGATKDAITEFMRTRPYRSLYTATAAPNDYVELGTSSECLGEMGYMDMLIRFFKSTQNTYAQGGASGAGGRRFSHELFGGKFRFRGHAEQDFWRWVCSWARAIRKPSDMGFDDGKFKLPKLITRQYIIKANQTQEGYLFDLPAVGLKEQRAERSRTIEERCEKAAEIINARTDQSIAWCYLNREGDLLEKLIKNCVQVCGDDLEEKKEEAFAAFESGQICNMVTKSTIAGFGMNWQFCHHQTHFPNHSFEQWYQAIRRSWRFGQTHDVEIDVITSEGESAVLKSIERKTAAAEKMFDQLVALMNNELKIKTMNKYTRKEKVPAWL